MKRTALLAAAAGLLVTIVFLTGVVPHPLAIDRTKAIGPTSESDTQASAAGTRGAPEEREISTTPDAELPESSIYHLQATWVDRHSRPVTLSSFKGQPVVVAMFYTHCGFTCPRIVHDLKGILSELPRIERRTVGVVLVSIDPERDTPEALKAFGKTHGLDVPQWTLLTGDDRDVRGLAAALDVRYREEPDDGFAHSNTITLLDPLGEIIAQRDGFSTNNDAFIAELRRFTRASQHQSSERNP